MTLLECLQSHKGGLIRLKTQLYWCGGRGYDGNPGRICLILDAAVTAAVAANTAAVRSGAAFDALLLIDGSPQWVWVAEEDVEFL